MFEKICKRKVPIILEYLTEIRKVLKEVMDRVECLSRQLYVDAGVKMQEIEHIIFLFSLALEDLRRAKQELSFRFEEKQKTRFRSRL